MKKGGIYGSEFFEDHRGRGFAPMLAIKSQEWAQQKPKEDEVEANRGWDSEYGGNDEQSGDEFDVGETHPKTSSGLHLLMGLQKIDVDKTGNHQNSWQSPREHDFELRLIE